MQTCSNRRPPGRLFDRRHENSSLLPPLAALRQRPFPCAVREKRLLPRCARDSLRRLSRRSDSTSSLPHEKRNPLGSLFVRRRRDSNPLLSPKMLIERGFPGCHLHFGTNFGTKNPLSDKSLRLIKYPSATGAEPFSPAPSSFSFHYNLQILRHCLRRVVLRSGSRDLYFHCVSSFRCFLLHRHLSGFRNCDIAASLCRTYAGFCYSLRYLRHR